MTQASDVAAKRSFIVGIAGGSASGKSTFTKALAEALAGGEPSLSVQITNTDHYFRHREPDGPRIFVPGHGEHFDFNRPNSADNARLIADLNRLSREEDAPAAILVEGLMVLHLPEVRELLDLRLFIELDADERALRRLLRNLGSKSPVDLEEAHWIADYYCASARVGHARYVEPSRVNADLIIRGDSDFARTAPMVAAIVRERLSHRGSC